MATAALVDKSNIDLGRRVIAALTREGIPVAVGLWVFASQSEEWQLTIATPLVDEVGPLSAYGRVQKALQKHKVEDEFPLRRIYLRSPKDRVLRLLQQESRALGHEDYRLVNAPIAGNFVEDAYLYFGFIDIQESENRGGTAPSTFWVTYAPYSGPGDATVVVTGSENLKGLLTKLPINREVVDSAIRELHARKRTYIPNVRLSARDLKRLKPA